MHRSCAHHARKDSATPIPRAAGSALKSGLVIGKNPSHSPSALKGAPPSLIVCRIFNTWDTRDALGTLHPRHSVRTSPTVAFAKPWQHTFSSRCSGALAPVQGPVGKRQRSLQWQPPLSAPQAQPPAAPRKMKSGSYGQTVDRFSPLNCTAVTVWVAVYTGNCCPLCNSRHCTNTDGKLAPKHSIFFFWAGPGCSCGPC